MKKIRYWVSVFTIIMLPSALAESREQELVAALEYRAQALEQELHALRAELQQVRRESSPARHTGPQPNDASGAQYSYGEMVEPPGALGTAAEEFPAYIDPQVFADQAGAPRGELSEDDMLIHAPADYPEGQGSVFTYLGGVPVVSSPYLGERAALDGGDLITNFPRTFQDLRLLEQRQKVENFLAERGIPFPERPTIEISGDVEIAAFAGKPLRSPIQDPANPGYSPKMQADIDLAEVEIDFLVALTPWITTFVVLGVDAGPPATGPRVANSGSFLNTGYITFGRLNEFPVYGTLGQIFVPFGRYQSFALSTTLVRDYARTKGRIAGLGFKQPGPDGLYVSSYIFNGDTKNGAAGNRSVNGGVGGGYSFVAGDLSAEIGGGWIANIADSQFLQSTGICATGDPETCFGGFNGPVVLEHFVPAVNVFGSVSIRDYTFIAEWAGATRAFAKNDLSFNGHGAQPNALNVEAVRWFEMWGKPANVALAYGWSDEALAIGLPRHRISGTFNVTWWRNTIESIEIRHDIDYKEGVRSGGNGQPMGGPIGTGRSVTQVTGQIGVYF